MKDIHSNFYDFFPLVISSFSQTGSLTIEVTSQLFSSSDDSSNSSKRVQLYSTPPSTSSSSSFSTSSSLLSTESSSWYYDLNTNTLSGEGDDIQISLSPSLLLLPTSPPSIKNFKIGLLSITPSNISLRMISSHGRTNDINQMIFSWSQLLSGEIQFILSNTCTECPDDSPSTTSTGSNSNHPLLSSEISLQFRYIIPYSRKSPPSFTLILNSQYSSSSSSSSSFTYSLLSSLIPSSSVLKGIIIVSVIFFSGSMSIIVWIMYKRQQQRIQNHLKSSSKSSFLHRYYLKRNMIIGPNNTTNSNTNTARNHNNNNNNSKKDTINLPLGLLRSPTILIDQAENGMIKNTSFSIENVSEPNGIVDIDRIIPPDIIPSYTSIGANHGFESSSLLSPLESIMHHSPSSSSYSSSYSSSLRTQYPNHENSSKNMSIIINKNHSMMTLNKNEFDIEGNSIIPSLNADTRRRRSSMVFGWSNNDHLYKE